jgi:hypothetical protein
MFCKKLNEEAHQCFRRVLQSKHSEIEFRSKAMTCLEGNMMKWTEKPLSIFLRQWVDKIAEVSQTRDSSLDHLDGLTSRLENESKLENYQMQLKDLQSSCFSGLDSPETNLTVILEKIANVVQAHFPTKRLPTMLPTTSRRNNVRFLVDLIDNVSELSSMDTKSSFSTVHSVLSEQNENEECLPSSATSPEPSIVPSVDDRTSSSSELLESICVVNDTSTQSMFVWIPTGSHKFRGNNTDASLRRHYVCDHKKVTGCEARRVVMLTSEKKVSGTQFSGQHNHYGSRSKSGHNLVSGGRSANQMNCEATDFFTPLLKAGAPPEKVFETRPERFRSIPRKAIENLQSKINRAVVLDSKKRFFILLLIHNFNSV